MVEKNVKALGVQERKEMVQDRHRRRWNDEVMAAKTPVEL